MGRGRARKEEGDKSSFTPFKKGGHKKLYINYRRSYILIMGRGRARKEKGEASQVLPPSKRGDIRSYILITEEVIY